MHFFFIDVFRSQSYSFNMKHYVFIMLIVLYLVACTSTSTDPSAQGTVNGRTTEDAGGDGTNTTGGA